jgi:hypothetical protein
MAEVHLTRHDIRFDPKPASSDVLALERETTTTGTLPKFLKVGVGRFPEIPCAGGPHFLRTFTRGAALSPAFDLALASLQAVQITSLPSAFLVRVFSMSCLRARFPKLRRPRCSIVRERTG